MSGFKKVSLLMSVAVLFSNPFSIPAFASDHEALTKTTVLPQAQPTSASSPVSQPASVAFPSPSTIASSELEQTGEAQVANDSPNDDTPKNSDAPRRRAPLRRWMVSFPVQNIWARHL